MTEHSATGHLLLGGGIAGTLVGAAVMLPPAVARLETGANTGIGIAMLSLGGALFVCGLAVVGAGIRRRRSVSIPGAVRGAVAAVSLFLAFFALETSDGLVRQGGRTLYWSSFLFVPVLALLAGLLAGRRWAWWTCRGVFALSALWFLVFTAMIPFIDLRSQGGPVPWYGRVYMIGVSVVFAGILVGAFLSLGRQEARRYFFSS